MITITATMTMIITITRRLLTWSTLVVTQCAWASTLSSHPVFTFYTDTLLFLFHISYFVSTGTVPVFRISFGLNFLSRLYQCKCLYFVCSIGKVWYNFHKNPCDAFMYFVFVVICFILVCIDENTAAPFDGREEKRSWSGLFQLFTSAAAQI